MTNWIITLCHNALPLTQRAIESFLAQDIGDVRVLAFNNGSTDGTPRYLDTLYPRVQTIHYYPQKGVSYGWDTCLKAVFDTGVEHALVSANDVELRSDTYRVLLGDGGGFVTGVGTSDGALYPGGAPSGARRPHPDFSLFLIRKAVWEEVGCFDETMVSWASDLDYHLRMEKAGIQAVSIDLPFYHVAAGTIKSASKREQDELGQQAERDRARFEAKWNLKVGSDEYYAQFKPLEAK